MLYTIRGLSEGAKGVTIRVRVISKGDLRSVKTRNCKTHTVADYVVGDQTGIITLTLWDEMIKQVNEDALIDIENGYVNRFKGRLRLNVGRLGKITKAHDPKFPTSDQLMLLANARRKRWRRS
ncbi:MAG: DNA-binding protein [Candidatus Bathyarchaeota archaeon]|nr:MAG: DNA-binding protein [Candidatus Bathyarchaeota archaeon]